MVRKGIRNISANIHRKARAVEAGLKAAGFAQKNAFYFDTLLVETGSKTAANRAAAKEAQINLRYYADGAHVGISVSEVDDAASLARLLAVFGVQNAGVSINSQQGNVGKLDRTSAFLTHPIFNTFHSETEMMRYLKRLENKDLSLTHAMIPLGSCTMKLNAAAELLPITWPEWAEMHPFSPTEQTQGYHELLADLGRDLAEATGFAAGKFATEFRCIGRVCRVACDPCIPCFTRRSSSRYLFDPFVGAWYKSGQCGYGRHAGCGCSL